METFRSALLDPSRWTQWDATLITAQIAESLRLCANNEKTVAENLPTILAPMIIALRRSSFFSKTFLSDHTEDIVFFFFFS